MPPTNIVLTPIGSGGDVHPFVGVGRALRERGHDVTVITSEPFREIIENAGLRFIQHMSEEEIFRLIDNPDIWHPVKGLRLLLRLGADIMREGYEILRHNCDPDRSVFVAHTVAFSTRVFAEQHQRPVATVHLQPGVFRSFVAPAAYAPGRNAGWMPVPLQQLMWRMVDRWIIDPLIAPELNRLRAEVGLGSVRRPFKDWIHSPQCTIGLFPSWFGPPASDWPKRVHLPGFVLYDQREQQELSPQLEAFLAAGDPPIVFTPGTAHMHARDFLQAGIEASAIMGRRALLATMHADHVPADLPDHVRHVEYAPFSLLLPRCSAIVHHGGIGTCAQGLAAGIPQLTMPMGFDQPDNATHLRRLGVGSWIVPSKFTGARVAAALTDLLADGRVCVECKRWKAEMENGDPVGKTCEVIEQLI
jgi:UDP:flavonoid glycosyltransferase YjiC (YdhE family)